MPPSVCSPQLCMASQEEDCRPGLLCQDICVCVCVCIVLAYFSLAPFVAHLPGLSWEVAAGLKAANKTPAPRAPESSSVSGQVCKGSLVKRSN